MVLFYESELIAVTIVFLCLFWAIYLFLTSNHRYWKDKHIPHVEPHFPFGTDKELVLYTLHKTLYYQKIYTSFKNQKLVGLYEVNTPYLLIRDIELAKCILTKDFQHFMNRGFFDSDLVSPLNMDLFLMEGKRWKTMRSNLTPAFTSGKIKLMFHMMKTCSRELISYLTTSVKQEKDVHIKEIIERFTTDVIAACGFGIESNSVRNPDCEFMKNAKLLCEPKDCVEQLKQIVGSNFPWLSKKMGLKVFEYMPNNFFMSIVTQTISYRKSMGIIKNDFVDHLLRLTCVKNVVKSDGNTSSPAGQTEEGVSFEEIMAQATIFFAAGLLNTVHTITFCLYEIARHTDVQSKLVDEINAALKTHSGVMSYQVIQNLCYLEAVIKGYTVLSETLRRYPSIGVLNRKCNDNYKVPGMNLIVEKGTRIIIPVYSFHHDPDFYPEPYKFCPERFLDDSVKHVAYLAFGEGPRYCIAMTFTMLTMKLCIAEIVRNFHVSVSENTQDTIVISPKHFVTATDKPILLKLSKRDDV